MFGDANRPRVFVSSTIRDLRDLRSALKFWLQSMGCDVLMSEYNDFDRRPEQGVFESCFQAIESCDYYLLIVGGVRGSLYDGNVSVTQQEYRTAIRLAQQGRIRPIIMIRAEVATALGERRKLANTSVDESIIWDTPSEILKDPDFIQSFVEEIKQTVIRQDETSGAGEFVWHYRFRTFEELVQALRISLNLHRSLPQQLMLANLKQELHYNLAAMAYRGTAALPSFYHWMLRPLLSDVPVPLDKVLTPRARISLSRNQANALKMSLLAGPPSPSSFRLVHLQDALASGLFLSYDHETQAVMPTEIDQVMRSLIEWFDRYSSLWTPVNERRTEVLTDLLSQRERGSSSSSVDAAFLAWVYAVYNSMENILRLSTALGRYITDPDKGITVPSLLPRTPFKSEESKVENERPTPEQIENWLRDGKLTEP